MKMKHETPLPLGHYFYYTLPVFLEWYMYPLPLFHLPHLYDTVSVDGSATCNHHSHDTLLIDRTCVVGVRHRTPGLPLTDPHPAVWLDCLPWRIAVIVRSLFVILQKRQDMVSDVYLNDVHGHRHSLSMTCRIV